MFLQITEIKDNILQIDNKDAKYSNIKIYH
jgi:hypothetical protein